MRSESEVLELILKIAKGDPGIRAVVLNGSRANPHARSDPFQDFDVFYLVTDVAPYRRNLEWIRQFGDLMILQMPDDMGDKAVKESPGYTYLMQFMDGMRIDLTVYPRHRLEDVTRDSLSMLILDKDGTVGPLPPPSENGHLPMPPTERQFADCCNEFWWMCPYVAKGVWRRQLVYARAMLDQVLRDELTKMLTWYLGSKSQFAGNLGGFRKYFEDFLEPDLWQILKRTYAAGGYAETWDALFAMGELFRLVARPTADHFGFPYPEEEDGHVSAYLRHVRDLPHDARSIY